MCIAHGRYLVVQGGRNNFVLDSAHVLDLMTRTWVDVSLWLLSAVAFAAGAAHRHRIGMTGPIRDGSHGCALVT